MATYSGFLSADGLPELVEDGTTDSAAMTMRRAVHVTLRDDGGSPVAIPDAVELRGDSLGWLESIAESVVAKLRARGRTGWEDLAAEQGGSLRVLGGHELAQSYEWSFTSAQTNQILWAGTPGVSWRITTAKATVDGDCTANVACRVGFSSTGSLPTLTANSLTPVRGTAISEADIAPGSGIVDGVAVAPICQGNPGDSLLITCDTAPTGALRVKIVMYPVTS